MQRGRRETHYEIVPDYPMRLEEYQSLLDQVLLEPFEEDSKMIAKSRPQVVFENGFDAREAAEARDRGYRSHVWVEFASGERFPVIFYDPTRLQQDLDDEIKQGSPFIAEPGLIVLPEVTRENMEKAVFALVDEGFFDALRPASEDADAQVR